LITAVDTNILLDILIPGAPHAKGSLELFEASQRDGATVVSEAVYAELASRFDDAEGASGFLSGSRIELVASTAPALHEAGKAWLRYLKNRRRSEIVCQLCGSKQAARCVKCHGEVALRQHIVTDFLIGAHALHEADRLATRDLGFYRTYFPKLELLVE
jgi:hypothetical protein